MKRVGLIAGVHTEATVRYLRQFDEQMTDRFGLATPVGVFINSINGRAFETAMKQQDMAQVQQMCLQAAEQCAAAGAEALLLGNSQFQVGADAIRKAIRIPLLDLVETTLAVAANAGVRRIGLIGIRFEAEGAIWQERCGALGLMASVPTPEAAARVSAIVSNELSQGFVDGASKAELVRLCADFRREGSRAVVLAAPELQLALGEGDSALPVLDATVAHVSAAIEWATSGRY